MTTPPDSPITVLGLPGSLRADSYNRRLLVAASELVPDGITLDVYDRMPDIPVFNQDEEDPQPEVIADLRARIRAADALLIATPEYNRSIPGGLKNVIDWLSRGGADLDVLRGRPTAVIGATTGMWGTRVAQEQVRHILSNLGADVLYAPVIYVPRAAAAFDGPTLTDEHTRSTLPALLRALAARVR